MWVVLLLIPATAQADGLFTVFGGASFGDDDSEKVGTWGVSLAGMSGGIFGFELDFGRTGKAKTDAVFVTNGRTTTVTGNIVVGIPLGAVRLYAVGGLGWVRTEADATDGSSGRDGGLGIRGCHPELLAAVTIKLGGTNCAGTLAELAPTHLHPC